MNTSTQRTRGHVAVVSVAMGLPAVLVVSFTKHRATEVIHQILRSLFHFAFANVRAALSVGILVTCFLLVDWIVGPFHIIGIVGSVFRNESSERSR